MWNQIFENSGLDGFAFCGGLDHQIGLTQIGQSGGCVDKAHSLGLSIGCDQVAADLAFQIAINQGHGGPQRIFADIGHQHVIPGKGENMRNTVTHLACANDTYPFDCHHIPLFI